MSKLSILLLAMIGLLTGCGEVVVFGHTVREGHASDVKPETLSAASTQNAGQPAQSATTVTAATQIAAIRVVKSATVSLTPQAAAKIAADPRFKSDALLDVVKQELRSRKLFAETDSQVTSAAEIVIDDFAVHATANAVIFGRIMSAGTLSGEIRLRTADGNELQTFRVDAASRLSIAESGEDTNPLAPLYRRFAVLAGNRLSGAPAKNDIEPDQRPR